jgi:hypothetical protein
VHNWTPKTLCQAFHKAAQLGLTNADRDRIRMIVGSVPGYSNAAHYLFFKACLLAFDIKMLLMLGVYRGRDICMLQAIARDYCRPHRVVGVDKFSDTPCEDWTEAQKQNGHWIGTGFGPAPTLLEAQCNISAWMAGDVELVQENDEAYLDSTESRFDMIYLDTSHDYETVRRQLRQINRLLPASGIVAGDDYSDHGTWGVKSAVADGTTWHAVFEQFIWITDATKLK